MDELDEPNELDEPDELVIIGGTVSKKCVSPYLSYLCIWKH